LVVGGGVKRKKRRGTENDQAEEKKKKKRVADLIGQIYIVILERGKWMSQFSSFLNSGLKT
jgi:hypothetical protein